MNIYYSSNIVQRCCLLLLQSAVLQGVASTDKNDSLQLKKLDHR